MTQERVLRDVHGRKPGAVAALMRVWSRPLRNYFRRRRFSEVDTDDLVSSTMMTIMVELPREPRRAEWSSWVYTVARNVAVDMMRDNGRQAGIQAECAQLAELPKTSTSTKLRREKDVLALDLATEDLPGFLRRQAEYELEGTDSKEIAEQEGIALGTVRTRGVRLRKTLKERFEAVRESLG